MDKSLGMIFAWPGGPSRGMKVLSDPESMTSLSPQTASCSSCRSRVSRWEEMGDLGSREGFPWENQCHSRCGKCRGPHVDAPAVSRA